VSLEVHLNVVKPSEVYWSNLTHNLIQMAVEANLYACIWNPDKHGMSKASQLIEPLEAGLAKLRSDPECFRRYNPANGWGNYDCFVRWVEKYLLACKANPDANVEVSR
jgi:hypothetical protein